MLPLARHLWHPLRHRAGRVRDRLRFWRGHVDGVVDGALVGWVVLRDPLAPPPEVGLFSAGGLVSRTTANLMRDDLRRAGVGDGCHGFAFPLDAHLRMAVEQAGGRLSLRLLGPRPALIGHWHFSGDRAWACRLTVPPLAQFLHGALLRLAAGAEVTTTEGTTPPLSRHRALFAARDHIQGGPLPPLISAYGDHLRYRHRQEAEFPLADPATPARLLKWVLAACGPLRRGLRVPLSASQIAWLNGQDAGAPFPRAVMLFLPAMPALWPAPDTADGDWRDAVAYWWAVHQAPALQAEDCLIPDAITARLSRLAPGAPQDWPLSIFLDRLRTGTPAFAWLDPAREGDRRRLTLAALLMAADTPGILRFVPKASITRALEAEGRGPAPLASLARTLAPDAPPLTRGSYRRALRQRGFDLALRRFLTLTAEGDRLEAARHPVPAGAAVAVQIIGPFRKSSGLGEATRATARALRAAGFAPHCVDFDLDNPAPEGFDPVGDLGRPRRAQVNILHLNAESVPLAFATLPDVFSGARNIAYMFWELDSPAACHHLAFALLDEIWVASDHGFAAYQPHTALPVIRIGLPAPRPGPIPRHAARRELAKRTDGGDFIALATFDSFSFIQRKNPLGAITAFRAAFPDDPGARLLLKTHNRRRVHDPAQDGLWEQVDRLIRLDPRIILMDETLPREGIMRLMRGADVYLSLHRSEGWGFGMIEAMALGVPVLASSYSGNLAYCRDDTAWLVPTAEVALAADDYIFVRQGQKRGDPDLAAAARLLRELRADPAEARHRAACALRLLRDEFSPAVIGAGMAARLMGAEEMLR